MKPKKSVTFKNTRKLKLPFTKSKHHNTMIFKNTYENVESKDFRGNILESAIRAVWD